MRRNRERLVEAAARLFEEKGYRATTVRDVAEAAGLTTGALFSSLGSKDGAYAAAFGHPPLTPEQGRALLLAVQEGDLKTAQRVAHGILVPEELAVVDNKAKT